MILPYIQLDVIHPKHGVDALQIMSIIISVPRGTERKVNQMYYWMHKEYGYIVPENKLWEDAEEMGYDDIIDPCSVEYGNFSLYYEKTNMAVK